MKKIIITFALIAGLMTAKGQTAQEAYNLANTAMTFLAIPADARSAGMGDMGIATPVSNYAHHHNPAKYLYMDPDRKGAMNLYYSPWLRKLVKDMSISGVSGFYRIDELQVVSASFRYFKMGDVDMKDENDVFTGTKSPYELALDLAYSRLLSKDFSLSLALRYGASDIGKSIDTYIKYKTAHVVAFDIAGYYTTDINLFGLDSKLGAGFGLKNIGTKVKYASDQKFFLPAELKLGANLASKVADDHGVSLGFEVGKYLVSADPDDLDKSVISGVGASFSDGDQFKKIVWQFGAEYDYKETVFVRTGYFYENKERGNRQYMTFGAGVVYKILQLDGAYLVPTSGRQNPLENTFRLSLSVTF